MCSNILSLFGTIGTYNRYNYSERMQLFKTAAEIMRRTELMIQNYSQEFHQSLQRKILVIISAHENDLIGVKKKLETKWDELIINRGNRDASGGDADQHFTCFCSNFLFTFRMALIAGRQNSIKLFV